MAINFNFWALLNTGWVKSPTNSYIITDDQEPMLDRLRGRKLSRVRLTVPPNTLQVISGTGFLQVQWPNQQCQELKKDRVLSTILGFNPIRSTPPRYSNITYMQYEEYKQTQMNLCTVKWTKPNPENCKNCSSNCAYDCARNFSTQYNTEQYS